MTDRYAVSLFESRDSMLASSEIDAFIAAAATLTGRDDLGFELGRRSLSARRA